MGGKCSVHEFIFPNRMLMLHADAALPDAEWSRYIDDLRGCDVAKTSIVVLTSGGAPNAAQRKALNDVLAGRRFTRAIITDSQPARLAVTAGAWFAPGMKAFLPSDVQAALAHAEWPPTGEAAFWSALRRMKMDLQRPILWLDAMLGKL